MAHLSHFYCLASLKLIAGHDPHAYVGWHISAKDDVTIGILIRGHFIGRLANNLYRTALALDEELIVDTRVVVIRFSNDLLAVYFMNSKGRKGRGIFRNE